MSQAISQTNHFCPRMKPASVSFWDKNWKKITKFGLRLAPVPDPRLRGPGAGYPAAEPGAGYPATRARCRMPAAGPATLRNYFLEKVFKTS